MRILFVTSNRIGDAILSTGVLDHLLSVASHPRLWVACGPAPAPLFANIPGIERVVALEKERHGRHWLTLWRQAVRRRWDLVVDLRGSMLAWTVPAQRRIVLRPDRSLDHRVVQLARLFRMKYPPAPRVWLPPSATAHARRLVPEGGPTLALGPTANWEGKRWPAERFVDLAERLTAPDAPLPGASILIAGAAHERKLVADAVRRLPEGRVVDLFGRDLPVVAACLSRADLFVGNDSGLMHLAAATGVPTLGLFGPSRDEHYAPWGETAMAVRTPESFEELTSRPGYDHRTTPSLMGSLSVDRVEAAARTLLGRAERRIA